MCYIYFYRLFTTQTSDFPGSNLLATQQPEELTRFLICLKTCQWVSITYRIKSCIRVLQNLPLPIDAVTPALLFASDTRSFSLSMLFLLFQPSFLPVLYFLYPVYFYLPLKIKCSLFWEASPEHFFTYLLYYMLG